MTEANSSTTLPDNAAVPSFDNADLVQKCDLLLLRLEQRRREQALKRSRCETSYGLDLRSDEGTGSPSNTNLSTTPAAIPTDNGHPGPSSRRGQLRAQGLEQWERYKEIDTSPIQDPHIPRSETPRPSTNTKHPNATNTVFHTGAMGGTPSGFIAFSLPNPSRHEPPSFSPNITHPNIWCRGTPTPYVRPDAGTVNPLEREHARGKLRRPIIQEPSVRRPGPPQFNPNVKHPNAATTNLNARPIVGPPSGPLVFGPPPPPVNQTQTPSFSPDIAHPNIWRQGIPASYVSPEAVTMERLQHENALRKMRSPITQKQNVRLIKLPCFKLSNAEATKFLPNPIPTVPSTFAERRAVRLTNTDPSGVAGPAKVVTTVTRTPQRAISASEVFREVRDCVIEYLGSDVQK